jgi:protein-tyrosine phosphatase
MSLGKRVVLVANADVVSRTNAATLVSCYRENTVSAHCHAQTPHIAALLFPFREAFSSLLLFGFTARASPHQIADFRPPSSRTVVFRKGFTAAQAWAPFNFTVGPDPFCLCGDDYTGHQASLDISPIDIVEGLYQAMSLGVFDADGFDPEAYASLEEMECCADAVKGSFITLRAPKDEFSRTKADYENGIVHGPAEYIEPFKERGVTTVVRLCQEEYDEAVFVGAGFKHIDLCFAERSLPTEELLTQWFATCCQEIMTGGGCIAVHCKDGVGRSQLLVACFLMARHKMTSRRAIGYLRLIWPGSIAGLQQEFLEENQEYLWRIGKSHETKPRCDEISRVSKSERRAPGTRRRLLRWGSSESVDEETEKSHFSMVQVKESAVEMARKARDIAMAAKKRAAKIAASKGSVAEGKEAAGTSSWYTRCKNTYKIVKGGRRKKINPLDELDHSGRHDDLIGTLSL